MSTITTGPLSSQLTPVDKARLESFAPLFGIEFCKSEGGRACLRFMSFRDEPEEHVLPEDRAYVRLLAELCSRSVRWIYFHPGESAHVSFLGLTDARIKRVSELYARWRKDTISA